MKEGFSPEFNKDLFEEKEMKMFVKRREIKEEDFYLIKELSKIDKEILIINFHNFFSFAQDKSAYELGLFEKRLKDKEELLPGEKELLRVVEIYKDLTEKYTWYATNHLNSILESL